MEYDEYPQSWYHDLIQFEDEEEYKEEQNEEI